MKVRELMTADPRTLGIDATLGDTAEVMSGYGIRHLPIVEDGAVVGIITDRDLKMALGPEAAHLDLSAIDPQQADGRVDWFMTEGLIQIDVDADVADAAEIFLRDKTGALPVVDAGELVGILSVLDVVKAALPLLKGR